MKSFLVYSLLWYDHEYLPECILSINKVLARLQIALLSAGKYKYDEKSMFDECLFASGPTLRQPKRYVTGILTIQKDNENM